jgi:hypothetical protein
MTETWLDFEFGKPVNFKGHKLTFRSKIKYTTDWIVLLCCEYGIQ